MYKRQGKTRLARYVAARTAGYFRGGAWLVECDALSTREELARAVCAVLGVDASAAGGESETIGAAVATSLGERDESGPVLLVLDCFEHLTERAAPFVDALLRAAPQIFCLVTSRVILGLPREFEYPLSPMAASVTPAEAAAAAEGAQHERRRHAPAPVDATIENERPGSESGLRATADGVALFMEAAVHVLPGFRPDRRERALVRRICDDLEGIPLALILAASRLRHLTLDELLTQVRAGRFEVLRRRAVGRDRHAALQEVIAGSFGLLPAESRHLLRRLCVFVGGFYYEDAWEVACDGPTKREALFEGLAQLRENSLLQVQRQEGRTRFKLLDTVREYVSGKADSARSAADGDHLDAVRYLSLIHI